MKNLIAHRGMSSLAPENTLSAFSLCKEYGIQWLECDVDILKDGTVIISHDSTLDRCTNKTGYLHDIKVSDLSSIDAGSWFGDNFIGEKLPTIMDLIELANKQSLNLNIEIKCCSPSTDVNNLLIDNIIIALKNLNPDRDLIVSSFNHLILAEFKKRRPETKVACLFETKTLEDDWNAIISWCEADYIHPEDKGLTREIVESFKKAGVKINVWTVNDLARANELFNWGVDGIFTDIAHKFPSHYKHK